MNLPVLMAYRRIATQWRYASAGLGGVLRTGLDYAAVMPVLQAVAAEMPEWSALELLDELQVLEEAMIEADAERMTRGADA